jgi:hypothetical protein
MPRAKESEVARFRRFIRTFGQAVRFEQSTDSFSENEARVLEKVLNSSKVTVVAETADDSGENESVPGDVRRFFAALIGPKLKEHQSEGIEPWREGRTSCYGLSLSCDPSGERFLYLQLDVAVKNCAFGIYACGKTRPSFKPVRDYLLKQAPELWSAATGEGGGTAQKQIDFSGTGAWSFAVDELARNPKEQALRLKSDVDKAFHSFLDAIAAVDG